ncbi:hypothetical protein CYMTET_26480 [Cymbomonas tetramitiformis]|uniref:Uncharacterized protein n=1 Tax=Cymbomonas tetramitiformis TaxID=36881 RepID=A0AAE0FRN4_9CHLO|nr:hypothetical protein CYMTET_26480 [Cymbomonas tetramitiformis]
MVAEGSSETEQISPSEGVNFSTLRKDAESQLKEAEAKLTLLRDSKKEAFDKANTVQLVSEQFTAEGDGEPRPATESSTPRKQDVDEDAHFDYLLRSRAKAAEERAQLLNQADLSPSRMRAVRKREIEEMEVNLLQKRTQLEQRYTQNVSPESESGQTRARTAQKRPPQHSVHLQPQQHLQLQQWRPPSENAPVPSATQWEQQQQQQLELQRMQIEQQLLAQQQKHQKQLQKQRRELQQLQHLQLLQVEQQQQQQQQLDSISPHAAGHSPQATATSQGSPARSEIGSLGGWMDTPGNESAMATLSSLKSTGETSTSQGAADFKQRQQLVESQLASAAQKKSKKKGEKGVKEAEKRGKSKAKDTEVAGPSDESFPLDEPGAPSSLHVGMPAPYAMGMTVQQPAGHSKEKERPSRGTVEAAKTEARKVEMEGMLRVAQDGAKARVDERSLDLELIKILGDQISSREGTVTDVLHEEVQRLRETNDQMLDRQRMSLEAVEAENGRLRHLVGELQTTNGALAKSETTYAVKMENLEIDVENRVDKWNAETDMKLQKKDEEMDRRDEDARARMKALQEEMEKKVAAAMQAKLQAEEDATRRIAAAEELVTELKAAATAFQSEAASLSREVERGQDELERMSRTNATLQEAQDKLLEQNHRLVDKALNPGTDFVKLQDEELSQMRALIDRLQQANVELQSRLDAEVKAHAEAIKDKGRGRSGSIVLKEESSRRQEMEAQRVEAAKMERERMEHKRSEEAVTALALEVELVSKTNTELELALAEALSSNAKLQVAYDELKMETFDSASQKSEETAVLKTECEHLRAKSARLQRESEATKRRVETLEEELREERAQSELLRGQLQEEHRVEADREAAARRAEFAERRSKISEMLEEVATTPAPFGGQALPGTGAGDALTLPGAAKTSIPVTPVTALQPRGSVTPAFSLNHDDPEQLHFYTALAGPGSDYLRLQSCRVDHLAATLGSKPDGSMAAILFSDLVFEEIGGSDDESPTLSKSGLVVTASSLHSLSLDTDSLYDCKWSLGLKDIVRGTWEEGSTEQLCLYHEVDKKPRTLRTPRRNVLIGSVVKALFALEHDVTLRKDSDEQVYTLHIS